MSDKREEIAAICHEMWSDWMVYVFSLCANAPAVAGLHQRSIVIPPWAVERWTRQMATKFADLPQNEKESDREVADKYFGQLYAVLPEEGRAEEEEWA